MAEKRKFEAWLHDRDLRRAEEHFENSGLRTISEYTRQCVVLGSARYEAETLARISELTLLVNRLAAKPDVADAQRGKVVPPSLIKSLRHLIRELEAEARWCR